MTRAIGDADMARSRRHGVISATRNFLHQISDNVTKPMIIASAQIVNATRRTRLALRF
jgi:hypothetical protein